MTRGFVIEGPNGGPLGSEAEVMAGLNACFGEVRSEVRETARPHRGLVGWGKLYGVWVDIVSFSVSGRRLAYPQVEAYVDDPDGWISFVRDEDVQRIHVVFFDKIEVLERVVAAQGWTCRRYTWRDWFRTR